MSKLDELNATKSEVIDYCFKAWRNNNRDYSKAARQIKRENISSATRTTLSRWAEKYDWEKRANTLDENEQKAERTEDIILNDLMLVHTKLMDVINTKPITELDTATINTLVRNAKEISETCIKIRRARQDEKTEQDEQLSNNYQIEVSIINGDTTKGNYKHKSD